MPTRVGQGYVFEASQPEQDEYDIPRHLLAPGPQDIYDVPPARGLLPSQYGQEVGTGSRSWGHLGPAQPSLGSWATPVPARVVLGLVLWWFCSSCTLRWPWHWHLCVTTPFLPQVYDTPPMAVKGPNGRDPSLDVYDVPPSVEKGLPLSTHHAVSSRWGAGPGVYTGLGATECGPGVGTHVCRPPALPLSL